MRYLITIFFLIAITFCFAGNPKNSAADSLSGVLSGRVSDDKNNNIQYVNVILYQNEKSVAGTQTKENGTYKITNKPPGKYKVKYQLMSYTKVTLDSILIKPGVVTKHNVTLIKEIIQIDGEPMFHDIQPQNTIKKENTGSE